MRAKRLAIAETFTFVPAIGFWQQDAPARDGGRSSCTGSASLFGFATSTSVEVVLGTGR